MLSVQHRLCPIDYSNCNQTVTIYHQNSTTKQISCTIIDRAYLDFKKNRSMNRYGNAEENTFLLIIPESSCKFVVPCEYVETVGTYTLAANDKVLLGAGSKISTSEWPSFIPSKVDNLVFVRNIDHKYWNGARCHLEAGG
ncbi:MAG: hypothetical protein RR087_04260 [Oscillospiraceae bacterium]